LKKIAIVVQRYGEEITGGAEQYARIIAEKLVSLYDVEILTSCALDYVSWDNHYLKGVSNINGVTVKRFTVERFRDINKFKRLREQTVINGNVKAENKWINDQGPYCPKLIEYIDESKDIYDVFIFVTYLYYTTVRGIGKVREKAILIPAAHDEEPIYFKIFDDVFNSPRALIFLTDEERDFTHFLFKNSDIPSDVIGLGIETPEKPDPMRFKAKYGLDNYILYTGRIDIGKRCPELFNFFAEYKKRNPSDLKLVLMGKEFIEIPKHPDIISLGFVSEEDKQDGMAGAKLFILPSVFESLSIVVLESMALGIPVVVNGECDVVKGHSVKSNAGLYFYEYYEFEGCINYLITHEDIYGIMKQNAKRYIEANYRWDVVTERFRSIIDSI
jgi:glycosyltransferase involved in cell wall biosynthesis